MLEKIFTSKARVKIMQFLFFEKQESYIREISKRLNISVSSVKREIDNFREIGLIGDGERVNYFDNIRKKRNMVVYRSALVISESEARECVEMAVKFVQEIRTFVQEIRTEVGDGE